MALSDIYAQRVNPSGLNQWNVDGVAACAAINSQVDPRIVSDDAGGAIVTWIDSRDYDNTAENVFAQRLSPSGAAMWTPNGEAICTATGTSVLARPVPDGAGGAVVTWSDTRTAAYDVYAQRINKNGSRLWTTNGVALCTAPNAQLDLAITPDGFGGAIVAWSDARDGLSDIYANRVSPGGGIPTAIGKTPASSIAVNTYPNPFATSTSIDITLSHEADVSVEVFDVAGRRVRAIELGRVSAGTTPLRLDGRNQYGQTLPSGVYFCRIHAGSDVVARKIVIQR